MKRILTTAIVTMLLGGCAHGDKEALAVLAVSGDEIGKSYAEAKRKRLVYCEAIVETEEEAKQCMGPYFGDRGTQLLETVVAAQEAMTEGIEALHELRELIDAAKEESRP